jgi:hypothetical protein
MTTPTSLCVDVAERSWPERRPGVLVLAVMSAGTEPC